MHRRALLAGLIASPALIAIDRLMPVRLWRESRSWIFEWRNQISPHEIEKIRPGDKVSFRACSLTAADIASLGKRGPLRASFIHCAVNMTGYPTLVPRLPGRSEYLHSYLWRDKKSPRMVNAAFTNGLASEGWRSLPSRGPSLRRCSCL